VCSSDLGRLVGAQKTQRSTLFRQEQLERFLSFGFSTQLITTDY
jgi:hypothetical protein